MAYRCLAGLLFAFLLAVGRASAVTVTALALPYGLTVDPEGQTRQVSIGADRTVAAVSSEDMGRPRAFRWNPGGVRTTFHPLPVLTAPDRGEIPNTVFGAGGVAVGPDSVYVAATEPFSGAYSGVSFQTQRWVGGDARRWTLPGCAVDPVAKDQHVYAVDARGRVALTIDITGANSHLLMQDDRGAYAPHAFIVEGDRCRTLGRAVVFGLRGRWAAGYRGYFHGVPASTILNEAQQRMVAVRWRDGLSTELGDGVAYAVNAAGLAVGASALAGLCGSVLWVSEDHRTRRCEAPTPHALAWDVKGRKITLESRAARSVAYDVGDDGTAVGMLQDAGGKHYAFRWRAGRVQRLDDLTHPPGWRFESAYAIAPDGTIAGIGTYRGLATVFTWHE